MEPDLAGFTDAQQRLREGFGEPVVFLFPTESTWPPGTPLDPETGNAMDPTLAATASAQASATVNCTFTSRPLARGGAGPAESGGAGLFEVADVMAIADISAASAMEGATEFQVRDERFKVMAMRPDGIGGVQRFLAFGRKRG